MILRLDRWGTELPPPSDPDLEGGGQSVVEKVRGKLT
jgi:hypothetical protein